MFTNRLDAILGGDEPKYGVAGQMEEAWRHFLNETLPEEIKGQCDSTNLEILKRVFMGGFMYGTKWRK